MAMLGRSPRGTGGIAGVVRLWRAFARWCLRNDLLPASLEHLRARRAREGDEGADPVDAGIRRFEALSAAYDSADMSVSFVLSFGSERWYVDASGAHGLSSGRAPMPAPCAAAAATGPGTMATGPSEATVPPGPAAGTAAEPKPGARPPGTARDDDGRRPAPAWPYGGIGPVLS